MENIDFRFNAEMIACLRSMIGKNFIYYIYDSFFDRKNVYGVVGLCVEQQIYKVTNFFECCNHFGKNDDVGVFKIGDSCQQELERISETDSLIHSQIGRKIVGIKVVNENQRLYNKSQKFNVWLTRGIIFQFENGEELSLEKQVWFSQMIAIKEGTKLLDKFSSLDAFLEEWRDCAGVVAEVDRSIVDLIEIRGL
jgi:hypothetical protein